MSTPRFVVHIGGRSFGVIGEFGLAALFAALSRTRLVEERNGTWAPIHGAPIALTVEILPSLPVRRPNAPAGPSTATAPESTEDPNDVPF